MTKTYRPALQQRAALFARRLNDAGLQADVVEGSLRNHAIKVSIAHDAKDLGRLVITNGKKGLKYNTGEMKTTDLDPVLELCWNGDRIEETRGISRAVAAVSDVAGTISRHAYVDGSYIDGYGGYGAVIREKGRTVEELSGVVPDPESRNIDGEIEAVLQVLAWCARHDVEEIAIHHDYVGLSKWVEGSWKTKKELTRTYAREVRASGVDITWVKVQAHSGDEGNERADALARRAAAACTAT